jgi:hypothetical protein
MQNMSRGIPDAAYSAHALIFSAPVFSPVLVFSSSCLPTSRISHLVFALFAVRPFAPALHAVLLGIVTFLSPSPHAYARPTCPAPIQHPTHRVSFFPLDSTDTYSAQHPSVPFCFTSLLFKSRGGLLVQCYVPSTSGQSQYPAASPTQYLLWRPGLSSSTCSYGNFHMSHFNRYLLTSSKFPSRQKLPQLRHLKFRPLSLQILRMRQR